MFDLMQAIKARTFIIAEVGCNHNGSIEIARRLIEAAADAGADAAKFQSFYPELMITTAAPKADYQIRATGTEETQYQRLQRMRLRFEEHVELKELCHHCGLIYCSSPFDEKSVEELEKLDVPFFKIPSGEITNLPLLQSIGDSQKAVVLSTGMAELIEVEEAITFLGRAISERLVLLHCVSNYPSSWEGANLRAIETMRNRFKVPTGFSDHSTGIELPLAAVALGAVIIEKHITLDRSMEGGDHKASLEPREFKKMVAMIRKLEIALGSGIKKCTPEEENLRAVARKSIVTSGFIKKGNMITAKDLLIKRPGTGIQPKFFETIVGSVANEDIPADTLIRWQQIKGQKDKHS